MKFAITLLIAFYCSTLSASTWEEMKKGLDKHSSVPFVELKVEDIKKAKAKGKKGWAKLSPPKIQDTKIGIKKTKRLTRRR
ncbi:MAG: hypothetical protein HOE90_17610 [Bacteriovoracaceae bacterium]|jgi:hypothetical protein|nr:hypothetical protein [Bacteriovoracaceae bacterium]